MRAFSYVAFLLTMGSSLAFAQQNGNDASRASLEKRKEVFEQELALLVDDMERVCALSQSQMKQLRAVARAAANSALKSIAARKEEITRRYTEAERELDSGNDLFVASRNAELTTDVSEERSWVNGIEQIVTKDQRKKYALVVRERLDRRRKAAVSSFVTRVDMELLLSFDQRASLVDLVDEGFGAQMARGKEYFAHVLLDDVEPPIDHAVLKSLFSKPQFAIWQELYENELKPFGKQQFRWKEWSQIKE